MSNSPELSRGFAFATMATPEQADEVISHCNQTELDGKTIKVEKVRNFKPNSNHGQTRFRPQLTKTNGLTTRHFQLLLFLSLST